MESKTQGELAGVVHKNIRALLEVRRSQDAKRTTSDTLADRVSVFAGSIRSVLLHALTFTAWQAQINERNAQLDLQVNLLAEHEVTRLIALTEQIAHKVGVPLPEDGLRELKQDVAPERVLAEIDRTQQYGHPASSRK